MEQKTPPQGYVCHRCKVLGMFIMSSNFVGKLFIKSMANGLDMGSHHLIFLL